MEGIKTFTVNEAHLYFAKSINGRVWELLQKRERSQRENDEILYAAHACTFHWLFSGTAVHQQRGEWLISHVHVVLGQSQEAIRHAQRCYQLTESNNNQMKDFDIAYAYEGLARAYALLGNHEQARNYYLLAQRVGESILDAEDRSIFEGDFQSGDWYGLLE